MNKLHFINNLILSLLISGFTICCLLLLNTNIGEGAKVGIGYLGGLFLLFSLFWIFMKWGQFTLQTKKIKNAK